MTAFTAKDPRCADVLAKLDLARRGMKQTLLTGKAYKPAASHMAPERIEPEQENVRQIRRRN